MHSFCTCCDRTYTRDYLFHNKSDDRVIQNMEPLIQGDDVQLYLPYGDVGFFKLVKKSPGFDDDYILDVAAFTNDCSGILNGEAGCKDAFFEGLCTQIQLKASIKTLAKITTRQRRHNTRDSRMLCLWHLPKVINELSICINIIVMAKLW